MRPSEEVQARLLALSHIPPSIIARARKSIGWQATRSLRRVMSQATCLMDYAPINDGASASTFLIAALSQENQLLEASWVRFAAGFFNSPAGAPPLKSIHPSNKP